MVEVKMISILTLFLKAVVEQVVLENLGHKAPAANQRISRDVTEQHCINNLQEQW